MSSLDKAFSLEILSSSYLILSKFYQNSVESKIPPYTQDLCVLWGAT